MEKDVDESIFTCRWEVQSVSKTKENQKSFKMNVPFQHSGKKLFLVELEMKKNPGNSTKHTLTAIKFLSFGHQSITCGVMDVTCFIGQEEENSSPRQQRIKISEEETFDEDLLKIYECSTEELTLLALSCPFVITIKAKLRSYISNFINKTMDSTWGDQLWAAAVNRKMTDVEFLVGEEAFGAHRSLISARSPVFAAMFISGMKEAATGQVRIEDVDPTTFQHFLKFLYTGMFEPSSKDRELFKVADKYGVETLMELGRPATKTDVDMDHVFKIFLSC